MTHGDIEAHRQAADEDAANRKNPATVRLALSALYCMERRAEADGLETIRQEKANARIGGVIDMRVIHDAQNQVASSRQAAKAYLGQIRGKALGCSTKDVVDAVALYGEPMHSPIAPPLSRLMGELSAAAGE